MWIAAVLPSLALKLLLFTTAHDKTRVSGCPKSHLQTTSRGHAQPSRCTLPHHCAAHHILSRHSHGTSPTWGAPRPPPLPPPLPPRPCPCCVARPSLRPSTADMWPAVAWAWKSPPGPSARGRARCWGTRAAWPASQSVVRGLGHSNKQGVWQWHGARRGQPWTHCAERTDSTCPGDCTVIRCTL